MDAKKTGEAHIKAKALMTTPFPIDEGINAIRYRLLEHEFKPITIKDNNVLVAPDWHIGFHCRKKTRLLIKSGKDYGVKTLVIPGDYFDCDEYKKFIRLSFIDTFKKEKEMAAEVLRLLLKNFKQIYFCTGNHEFRWIKENKGLSTVQDLFAIMGVRGNYRVTTDDHITLFSNGEKWRLAHPSNFAQSRLSVASRLANIYQCNILCAHGHQWNQGYSDSGDYQIVDGGGMFDMSQVEYLRKTSCFPAVHSGFYLIQDGYAIPFDGGKEKKP